jgi:hypothetical protein
MTSPSYKQSAMMTHCAKIAIYKDEIRYFDLFWNERTDSIHLEEDGRQTIVALKPNALLIDALAVMGYRANMGVDMWHPYLVSLVDIDAYLLRPLSSLEHNRIIITAPGLSYAGQPAMVGW